MKGIVQIYDKITSFYQWINIVLGIGETNILHKNKDKLFTCTFIRANTYSLLKHKHEEVTATEAIKIKTYVNRNEDNFMEKK